VSNLEFFFRFFVDHWNDLTQAQVGIIRADLVLPALYNSCAMSESSNVDGLALLLKFSVCSFDVWTVGCVVIRVSALCSGVGLCVFAIVHEQEVVMDIIRFL
jgi:hypothetical protein